jgi:hypothetical protein
VYSDGVADVLSRRDSKDPERPQGLFGFFA